MRTAQEAIDWALRQTSWRHGYCANFVQNAYDGGWVGYSAIDAWKRARRKHTDYPPPPGVPCYWGPKGSNPYGHIAVSLGGGKCRSTDYPRRGGVGTVDIRWIEQHWPNTGHYLGWSEDIAGQTIPGGGGAAPAHEEDDMTPEQAQMLAEVHAVLFKGSKGTPLDKTVYQRLERIEQVLYQGSKATPVALTVYQRVARIESKLGSG